MKWFIFLAALANHVFRAECYTSISLGGVTDQKGSARTSIATESRLFMDVGKTNDRENDYPIQSIPIIKEEENTESVDHSTFLAFGKAKLRRCKMSMLLVFSTASIAIWLWLNGHVGPGVVAAATAMSLRFNGISQWAMWVVADFFEHIVV